MWDKLIHGEGWDIAERPHEIRGFVPFIPCSFEYWKQKLWLFTPVALNTHSHITWVAKIPTLTFSGDQTFCWSCAEIAYCGLQESFPLQAVQCWESSVKSWTQRHSYTTPSHVLPRGTDSQLPFPKMNIDTKLYSSLLSYALMFFSFTIKLSVTFQKPYSASFLSNLFVMGMRLFTSALFLVG